MQIIVLHPRAPRVFRLQLTPLRAGLLAIVLCLLVAAASSAITWYVARAQPGAEASGQARDNAYLRANLAVLAARVGELQAQMVRLDALGERVSGLAGIAPQDFDFRHRPARGGPAAVERSTALTLPDLRDELARLGKQADHRVDFFDVIEGALIDRQLRERRTPSVMPVAVGYDGSSFGARIDPFSGRRTRHDGVDFVAPIGTPIVAAAGGVVVAAEWHPEYGNMIDIDHGNGLKTRYAHASKSLVKVGDLVRAGQEVARVGSTGRSTGAHLHFEVHVNGVPRNPIGFLTAAAPNPAPAPAIATAPVPTDRTAIR
ncbi:Murein DD-endopeptidase MepM and murein hydrolase activator NlpD, contain LysM domain [Cupriavidus sp. OV038]|jgi:murein DD-endopeptidase MepM/ murein hydrolase activator NlpD|uniref:M23 family metallopeptidase n=1 Tax=unclassified Cupriavidus TaxID=2640874 RepID=UPI0008F0FDBF|nr:MULTISPECIES: M23 family metallopeptidase [unclassified Cupriavidus]SFD14822.1 Murein DD-endopeptidase MepM and murein hydrolase activator NlpD, contain LysM domain [Cupriavidus sp. OV038]SFP80833.1 Murein DD-endopeptidase MepM and murein hydrolase activator NlpD, contain LysM domain [Cupriavidus sp. OV096]